MVNFKSEWSVKQLFYILNHLEFSQREMARGIGKKHGSVISRFVNDLESMGFVKKTYEKSIKAPKYEVVSPVALVQIFKGVRRMNELKYDTFEIGNNREEVKRLLSNKNAIMCLATALEHYDQYFRDPAVYAYAQDPNLLEELKNEQVIGGKIKVVLYEYDFADEIQIKNEIRITSPVRTIIDMYCNDLGYAVEPLVRKVWGHG